jgi:hypothetical protein
VRQRWLAALAPLLLVGCISVPSFDDDDHDHDRDDDRPKAEERARRYCIDEAKDRGLRIEDVGGVDKVGKKQYEVRLRVEPKKDSKDKGEKKKDGDFRALCRYDDKARRATLY